MRTAVSLLLVIGGGTAGDLVLSYAMKRVAAEGGGGVAAAVRRACRTSGLWIGLALHTIAFAALLALLSWAEVSFVVPATALSYAAGAAGARLFLHEHVSARRWVGVLLISSGVLLVLAG